jgi:type III restriction/modification enzyme restriction subunit
LTVATGASPSGGSSFDGPAGLAAHPFGTLTFRYEWRRYQRMILDLFEGRDRSHRTFHVVAPPGSGKTLVGIEIARRIGRPAVTFSPTTTIQEQWRDKVRMFVPETLPADGRSALLDAVSTDPSRLGAISSLTYQSLSTQTQEREFLDRLGHAAWLGELVADGRTEEAAADRLDGIRARSATVYARGVALRARRRKRDLLASGEASVHELLHPNALDLIDRIVAAGTGCIILDEAHHLLDYWALILGDLIERLPDALVVGLTATPPASAEPEELENYLRLVNGIDFEVPTPAVVRSGYLAPYQDLALVTAPTERERRFIAGAEERLEAAIERVFSDPRFMPRLRMLVNGPAGDGEPWSALLRDDFEVAVGAVRVLLEAGESLAESIELVPEMRRPAGMEDRLALVRDWCLDVLRLSAAAEDQATLGDLRAALRTVGLVMGETGWRRAPGPIDRVLAYSESKVAGMVEILRAESESLDSRLRAVVLTDFERASTTAQRQLAGVLDPESGGAVQAIRALVADPTTNALEPAMLTGRTVLLDAGWAPRFIDEARRWFAERGLRAELSATPAENGLALIDGAGPDWRPRHYVACLTALLERGVTRCLVGTRGLLAEGWDSLSLNTLVDLTTAGTFASVNQIRGRSIRLDPANPRKVANNWDVICHDANLEEGGRDLRRLAAKHRHVWGLAPGGRVVRGIDHVDERLLQLERPAGLPNLAPIAGISSTAEINGRAFKRAKNREAAYDRWGVGQPYENFVFHGTVLSTAARDVRTAFSWAGGLRTMLDLAIAVLTYWAVLVWSNAFQVLGGLPPLAAVAVAVVAFLLPPILAAPLFWRYARAAFLTLPVDSYLLDFGRAVAQAFRTTGLAPVSPDQVRVVIGLDGAYNVHLDHGDAEVIRKFELAYRELFEPIVDQRYLVQRDELSLSGSFYRPWWYVARGLFRLFRRREPYYHAVPSAFARKREVAEAFAAAWSDWVGGGELVYTRSPAGMRILLRERAARRLRISAFGVEQWR